MQNKLRRRQRALRSSANSASITSAIGMGETAGRLRARRNTLFAQTVIWVTGLICMAFLLGSLAQAWSNSQLAQQTQAAQQRLEQLQRKHTKLSQLANHYKDPATVESEARQQLGYVRPGEHPVVVVNENDNSQQGKQQQNSSAAQQGFWQEWWAAFFSE